MITREEELEKDSVLDELYVKFCAAIPKGDNPEIAFANKDLHSVLSTLLSERDYLDVEEIVYQSIGAYEKRAFKAGFSTAMQLLEEIRSNAF